jgi:hypothetical protein
MCGAAMVRAGRMEGQQDQQRVFSRVSPSLGQGISTETCMHHETAGILQSGPVC